MLTLAVSIDEPATWLDRGMVPVSTIDFFFDPACPWTWITSRWLVDAAGRRDIEIRWRNLSLSVVNADQEIPEQYRAAVLAADRAHRIIAALSDAERNDLVADFYTEWGRRSFHDGVEPTDGSAGEVADAVGAGQWSEAADDARWDDVVVASTREGQQLAGGSDVGSPVLSFGDPPTGIFGPIVSPAPTGDDAGALLDHVLGTTAMAGFYELKRGRQAPPQFGTRP